MIPSRRRCLHTLAGLTMTPWLNACQTKPQAPLSIASHVRPGYELMFLARQEGWLSRDEVQLLETPSASASLAALAEGKADGAALTLDETLRALTEGIPLQIVLVFDISAGADMLLARPGIRSLRDLAGQRIGLEQTALAALMLHKVLAAAGLAQNAVIPVPLDIDNHVTAWTQGRLDAVITYEPTASRLRAMGARRLYDSREIPDTIFDVLAVTPLAIARHPAALRNLVAAHFKALKHLRQHPQDAAHRMAVRLDMPAREVLESYRGLELPNEEANVRLLSNGRLAKAAADLAQVMHQAGLLKKIPPLADIAQDAFLP